VGSAWNPLAVNVRDAGPARKRPPHLHPGPGAGFPPGGRRGLFTRFPPNAPPGKTLRAS